MHCPLRGRVFLQLFRIERLLWDITKLQGWYVIARLLLLVISLAILYSSGVEKCADNKIEEIKRACYMSRC